MFSDMDKSSVDIAPLEEVDEFEDCEADDDINVWEDKWDDGNVEDGISYQLRSEHANQGIKMKTESAFDLSPERCLFKFF